MNAIYIRSAAGFNQVCFDSILYIKAIRNEVTLVTRACSYNLAITLEQMEWLLPERTFCRTHDHYLVNLENVVGSAGDIVFLSDGEIPICRRYRKHFEKRLEVFIEEDRDDYVELVSGFSLN